MEPCLKRRRLTMPFPPSLDAWSRGEVVDESMHPTILLHLGYVLSTGSSPTEADTVLIVLLCKHWSRLVQGATYRSVDIELEIDLCTQLLETSKNKEVIESVLRIVTALADETTDVVSDYLAKALILHVVDNSDKVMELLRKSATTSHCHRIIYTAACLMGNNSTAVDYNKVARHLFDLGIKLQQEQGVTNFEGQGADTFLWALSHSKQCAEKMLTNQLILQHLVRNKQSETLAAIAETCPTPTIAMYLADLLMNKQCEKHDVVLKGLLNCSPMLQLSDNLFNAVLDAARKESYSTVAVDLLCHLFDKSKAQSDKRLIMMLETNNARASEKAMSHIITRQQHICAQPASTNLLCSIAQTASRNSATPHTKQQAVDFFACCAKDKSQWIEMARQPKLVEVLVSAAPNPVAMETLWKISTPMSNQRILARHTGLLSSWIRFLRNIPAHNPQRAEWKDRLMQLADLL